MTFYRFKQVNGQSYIYEQWSYRAKGGKVRTKSRYMGKDTPELRARLGIINGPALPKKRCCSKCGIQLDKLYEPDICLKCSIHLGITEKRTAPTGKARHDRADIGKQPGKKSAKSKAKPKKSKVRHDKNKSCPDCGLPLDRVDDPDHCPRCALHGKNCDCPVHKGAK